MTARAGETRHHTGSLEAVDAFLGGINGENVTINGGEVTAFGANAGTAGIGGIGSFPPSRATVAGEITINGGQVMAVGGGSEKLSDLQRGIDSRALMLAWVGMGELSEDEQKLFNKIMELELSQESLLEMAEKMEKGIVPPEIEEFLSEEDLPAIDDLLKKVIITVAMDGLFSDLFGFGQTDRAYFGGGAGIGSCANYDYGDLSIALNGGSVTALGGPGAAGIGAGYASVGGNITITGGTVDAAGGRESERFGGGAGIGGGSNTGSGANITVSGTPTVLATRGSEDARDLGHAAGGNPEAFSLRDAAGTDLSYLRVGVTAGLGELPVPEAEVLADGSLYETNEVGLAGCFVPFSEKEEMELQVNAAAYGSFVESLVLPVHSKRVSALLEIEQPDNLQVHSVLWRDGEPVLEPSRRGAFHMQEFRRVILGPERAVALTWEISEENQDAVTFEIHRHGAGRFQISAGPLVTLSEHENLGTTQELVFIDEGLQPRGFYTYIVTAFDEMGNYSGESRIDVYAGGTGLADLSVTGHMDGEEDVELTLDPEFTFRQLNYNLEVDNEVHSLTFTPEPVDEEILSMRVNDRPVRQGDSVKLPLEIGQNSFRVFVQGRVGFLPWSDQPLNPGTSYLVRVNRANMEGLPQMYLESDAEEVDEGSAFAARGSIGFELEELEMEDVRFLGHIQGGTTYEAAARAAVMLAGMGAPGVKGTAVASAFEEQFPGIWEVTADYGDGTEPKEVELGSDGTFQLEHTYYVPGDYTIEVSALYEGRGLVTETLDVTVNNVPPVIEGEDMTGNPAEGDGVLIDNVVEVNDGDQVTLEGYVVDPGENEWELTVTHQGTGQGPIPLDLEEDMTFSFERTFYDYWQAEHYLAFRVEDNFGGAGERLVKVIVHNVDPEVYAGDDALTLVDEPFNREGHFEDPGRDTWTGFVDYGDGAGEQELELTEDKTFNLEHTYRETGTYNVTVRVEDDDGGEGTDSFTVTVKDYLLFLDAGEDETIDEGDTLEREAEILGPPRKIEKIAVDYGDGTEEQELDLVQERRRGQLQERDITDRMEEIAGEAFADGTGGWALLEHTYRQSGEYTVTVTVTDVDGDTYEDSFDLVVENVPPEVSVEVSDNRPYEGDRITISGSFTDPGDDTWHATVDFDDGSGEEELPLEDDKTFSTSHRYNRQGSYTITVTVFDDDGGEGSDTADVNVRRERTPSPPSPPPDDDDENGEEIDSSSNAYLVDLQVGGETVSGFVYNTMEYSLEMPSIVEVTATAVHEEATIEAFCGQETDWVLLTCGESREIGTYDYPERITVRVTAKNEEVVNKYILWKEQDLPDPGDTVPPEPEDDGYIFISNVTYDSMDLSWMAATDNVTAQQDLEYKVFYSRDGDIATVEDAEANGTVIEGWTAAITEVQAVGLSPDTLYYFNVLVRDEAGNKAAYQMTEHMTEAEPDMEPPVPGGDGEITTSNVTYTRMNLSWAAATDNVTAQQDLEYKVFYSRDGDIATVEDAEANGTVIEGWAADITEVRATGLRSNTLYYFNVLVRDEAGNKAAYQMTDQSTRRRPPSPPPGPVSATIYPPKVDFVKLGPEDTVEINITWNDASDVEDVTVPGIQDLNWFLVDNNFIEIHSTELEKLDPGLHQFTISFDVGSDAIFTVNIIEE